MSDSMFINQPENTEAFKHTKMQVWKAASSDKEIDLSQLSPPEYKYFSELYWLYNALSHGDITKEAAESKDRKNYEEYISFVDEHLDHIHGRIIINENIRRAGELLSEIEKEQDTKEIACKACRCIGLMIGDKSFVGRQMRKFKEV